MSDRRRFLACGTAALLVLVAGAAHALTVQPYSAQALASAQKAGQHVAVHFHADWCPTCRAQDKALQSLKDDPALKDITVLQADYDKETALRKDMGIRVQSTFVVFHGAREVTRRGGVTDPQDIKAVFTTRP